MFVVSIGELGANALGVVTAASYTVMFLATCCFVQGIYERIWSEAVALVVTSVTVILMAASIVAAAPMLCAL